jgi:WD40 repeat protein
MQNLRPISIVGLCLSIILTACAPVTLLPPPIPPTVQPTLRPATLVPTREPVRMGVPAIEYLDNQNNLLVISSVTGKPFDEFPSIPLGTYYNYAFSADGKTLAVVSSGQLYLIDLPSWKYRTSDIGLHGPIDSVIYSPDETLLALASGVPDGELRIVDAKSGAVKASARAGSSIKNVKFTTDGKALMIYGPQLAQTGIAANAGVNVGAPKATLFAVSDLSLLWSVELVGVRDGTFPKKADTANAQDIYQPGAAWHYEPGIAFAPNHDMLYVVHGDEDKLTTVDFSSKNVKTVDVHVQMSWLDQLLALTAGVAHAKGMDGTTKP